MWKEKTRISAKGVIRCNWLSVFDIQSAYVLSFHNVCQNMSRIAFAGWLIPSLSWRFLKRIRTYERADLYFEVHVIHVYLLWCKTLLLSSVSSDIKCMGYCYWYQLSHRWEISIWTLSSWPTIVRNTGLPLSSYTNGRPSSTLPTVCNGPRC